MDDNFRIVALNLIGNCVAVAVIVMAVAFGPALSWMLGL
jgi:hypothetical protein